MQPIDFRNETFRQIRERLSAQREAVHRAWLAHGPGTTREVAAKAQIDILSFRPRTTELCQIGLVVLNAEGGRRNAESAVPSSAIPVPSSGHEGVYRGVFLDEWENWCAEQRTRATEGQLTLI